MVERESFSVVRGAASTMEESQPMTSLLATMLPVDSRYDAAPLKPPWAASSRHWSESRGTGMAAQDR